MSTLATYEVQVADLLHDPNQQYWSVTQLDRYINEARTKLVMDTGCLRSLQTAYLTQGQEAITFGQVTGALINSGGSGYVAPTIGFSGGGGSGVAATLGVTGGAVTSITFTNFGSGYSSAPTASITNNAGAVTSLTVVTPGIGYTGFPAVGFSGGGGSGAAASSRLGIRLLLPFGVGSGYSVGDVLTATGGTFTRAAKVIVAALGGGGAINSTTAWDYGDYSALPAPASPMTGGTGTGATFSVFDGLVSSAVVTAGGTGYTSAPTVTLSGGGAATPQGTMTAAVAGAGTGASFAVGVIDVNTYDVIGVNLIWGSMRIPLQWRPWSEFSALMRAWVGQTRQPAMWAVYGDNQIFVGPTPDQTYQIEVDTVILPAALTGSTVDPIPSVAQAPIPYYAARIAKFNDQRFGEAETLQAQYQARMNDVTNAYTRRIPDITKQLK